MSKSWREIINYIDIFKKQRRPHEMCGRRCSDEWWLGLADAYQADCSALVVHSDDEYLGAHDASHLEGLDDHASTLVGDFAVRPWRGEYLDERRCAMGVEAEVGALVLAQEHFDADVLAHELVQNFPVLGREVRVLGAHLAVDLLACGREPALHNDAQRILLLDISDSFGVRGQCFTHIDFEIQRSTVRHFAQVLAHTDSSFF
ncbi:MAG: hypothetical protein UU40_C0012G0017 [Candidatus Uhrbacteria bacterium GW2011_GWD2_41_121]|uniref:Uncharacterized protein n=1 Tax=Candidatus Uhrbacteria bacterium GW2011_GWC1_41_20 TaxID=1618983 RepID=A0A0G0YEV9_9BACT|nr:MAG: hypothetical protein UT52_C0004G0017 [Candidatus Uhrbacteria bacterium GW2011_GWE1_39_46]KKR63787.1 MAG: hypothetical protein UU04_C0012G0025 [Candidatus Uhrbacteria bacterium GW2011_GWC2_40_450]KKR89427.1 MAG: hypothetical protein UU36_C0028G0003 [Candidatus Uhrbacteria bacterium GW2011_GWE2_41_1153]KKR89909.1 MAG: hypothetical protein UU40_C0012G0017 [Candidatus Uhrbacteria bacterium GW2011_GWD2_41_121]KKR95779.1 MAG: hypothetical protein UU46_C0014G0017 [Candidatus Uhrbacteria bacter